jgi:uncharacterized protein (TIGR02118 family)
MKMIELAHPLDGISRQEFHDHWRHPHGTLVKGIRPIRRYIQNHRIDTDLIPHSESPYLGIAEVWFDSLEVGHNLGNDPQFVKHVGPDEPNFVDQTKLVVTFMTEEVITANRPALDAGANYADSYWTDNDAASYISLTQVIQKGAGPDWNTDEDHTLAERLGAFRHVLNRNVDNTAEVVAARQLYWPSLTVFERAVRNDPAAFDALHNKLGSFLFLARAEPVI